MPRKKKSKLITDRAARELVSKELKKLDAYRNGDLVDPNSADTKLVSQLFGLTRTRISQLLSEGVIRNNGMRGRYVLTEVVVAYVNYLKKTKRGAIKERLTNQQERKLKLENNRVANTLVPIEQAAEVFEFNCRLWRAGAEAIPKSIAARIAKTDNPKEVSDILTEALSELVPAFRVPFDEFVGNAPTPLTPHRGAGVAK